mmetsp:Transcript_73621/g.162586  ORF Transcript_73621/g.162586 Transcript_73621/m.162586 type:complete len:210 (-) Transcript_73621:521-1150(-)
MVGRQGLSHRRGHNIGGSEVGHVQMIRQRDDGDQGAPPGEFPVLPILVTTCHSGPICQFHHGRISILGEVQIALEFSKVLAHLQSMELIESNHKGKTFTTELHSWIQLLQTMRGDQTKSDGFFQCVIPFIALPVHPGKVHLHLWPVFNAINGLVAFVETHDPVRFPLIGHFTEIHHQIPGISVRFQHIVPGQLPQETMEAGHGRDHSHL